MLAFAIFLAHKTQPSMQQSYEVKLVASPLPSAGPQRTATVAPPAPKAVAPAPKPKPAKTPALKVPLQAKPSTPAAAKPPNAPAPGEKPSTGTDVVTVTQEGIAFPDPRYLANIENQIYARWQHETFRAGLNVKIEFVILRDGSVDPKSVVVVKHSSDLSFDLAAQAAIELTVNARVFGALPAAWNGAALPIRFDFTQAAKGTP